MVTQVGLDGPRLKEEYLSAPVRKRLAYRISQSRSPPEPSAVLADFYRRFRDGAGNTFEYAVGSFNDVAGVVAVQVALA